MTTFQKLFEGDKCLDRVKKLIAQAQKEGWFKGISKSDLKDLPGIVQDDYDDDDLCDVTKNDIIEIVDASF